MSVPVLVEAKEPAHSKCFPSQRPSAGAHAAHLAELPQGGLGGRQQKGGRLRLGRACCGDMHAQARYLQTARAFLTQCVKRKLVFLGCSLLTGLKFPPKVDALDGAHLGSPCCSQSWRSAAQAYCDQPWRVHARCESLMQQHRTVAMSGNHKGRLLEEA